MNQTGLITEVIKHLPGQHNQLLHAGTHMTSSRVSRSDVSNDDIYADRILSAAADADLGKMGPYYVMLHRKLKGYGPGTYSKSYQQIFKEVDGTDMPQAAERWQKLFTNVADNSKRYYRGCGMQDIKDLIRTGYITPHPDELRGGEDISMTISPKVAEAYTLQHPKWDPDKYDFPEDAIDVELDGFALVIDAQYARTHAGAKARDYTDLNDEMYFIPEEKEGYNEHSWMMGRGLLPFFIDDLEVQAFKPIPKEAILGVITNDGSILSLDKFAR